MRTGRTVQGRLRQFIQNANVTAGCSGEFSIGGGGLQTIDVIAGGLPALTITDAVVLDAGTQEGFTRHAAHRAERRLGGRGLRPDARRYRRQHRPRVRDQPLHRQRHRRRAQRRRQLDPRQLDRDQHHRYPGPRQQRQRHRLRAARQRRQRQRDLRQHGDGVEIAATALGQPDLRQPHRYEQRRNRATPTNSGNSGDGVNVPGGTNTIGGTVGGEGNVISGNVFAGGSQITGTQAIGNMVQGNLIGSAAAVDACRRTTASECSITSGATGNLTSAAPGRRREHDRRTTRWTAYIVTGAPTRATDLGNVHPRHDGVGLALATPATATTGRATSPRAETACRTTRAPARPASAAGTPTIGSDPRPPKAAPSGSRSSPISAADSSGFGEGQRYLG